MQKRLEAFLHRLVPGYWIPLYTMVSFTRIPYREATNRAQRQDKILTTTAKGLVIVGTLLALRFLRGRANNR